MTFRALSQLGDEPGPSDLAFRSQFDTPELIDPWLSDWRARLGRDSRPAAKRQAGMSATNPAIIPRNHRIEAAIAAGLEGDFAPFHRLVDALGTPFDEPVRHPELTRPPDPGEAVRQTF